MIPLHAVSRQAYGAWLRKQAAATRTWLTIQGFVPEHGKVCVVPARAGKVALAVLGCGDAPDPWDWAAAAVRLPVGRYRVAEDHSGVRPDDGALTWGLAAYQYDRYKKRDRKTSVLAWPAAVDRAQVERTLTAFALGRDLINTPASDLGPAELADQAIALARRFGASHEVIVGDGLLARGFPTIHAVGRASARSPRLIDLRWGEPSRPRVTLVGKGVCFDSGGLDLKSASGMKLMKKDMGGAAAVLALGSMVMDAGLPIALRILIPAVENSVSGQAYRPGDVLRTRKGLTVEVGNTDAEGRLILSDALCAADEEDPEMLLDFATLTGAARVALGTELPALFCNDDSLGEELLRAGEAVGDPLWRLPLFRAYRRHLDSPVANLNNISSAPEGGAIVAALFLAEFVGAKRPWAHIDTMAWNVGSRPGRPAGGEVFGVRAVFEALRRRYGASSLAAESDP